MLEAIIKCCFYRINIISSNQAKSFRIRPKNSRLNCKKIEKKFGINLPKWEKSLESIIKEMNYTYKRPYFFIKSLFINQNYT